MTIRVSVNGPIHVASSYEETGDVCVCHGGALCGWEARMAAFVRVDWGSVPEELRSRVFLKQTVKAFHKVNVAGGPCYTEETVGIDLWGLAPGADQEQRCVDNPAYAAEWALDCEGDYSGCLVETTWGAQLEVVAITKKKGADPAIEDVSDPTGEGYSPAGSSVVRRPSGSSVTTLLSNRAGTGPAPTPDVWNASFDSRPIGDHNTAEYGFVALVPHCMTLDKITQIPTFLPVPAAGYPDDKTPAGPVPVLPPLMPPVKGHIRDSFKDVRTRDEWLRNGERGSEGWILPGFQVVVPMPAGGDVARMWLAGAPAVQTTTEVYDVGEI